MSHDLHNFLKSSMFSIEHLVRTLLKEGEHTAYLMFEVVWKLVLRIS